MVKCPFCSYANEDGALFCEQCKSDISNVAPTPPPPAPPPTPMPESMPPVALALPAEEPVPVAVVEEVEEIVPVEPVEEIAAVAIVEEVKPTPAEPVAEAIVAPLEPAPAAIPAGKPATGTPIPAGASVKLVVQRGIKIGEEFPLYPGENYVGRADEKPVDIDLTFQEPEDRVWCSRQHALLSYDDTTGNLTIEDLNSANGTFVNRERVYPGQPRQLFVGNTIQIGTVHLRVKV